MARMLSIHLDDSMNLGFCNNQTNLSIRDGTRNADVFILCRASEVQRFQNAVPNCGSKCPCHVTRPSEDWCISPLFRQVADLLLLCLTDSVWSNPEHTFRVIWGWQFDRYTISV